MSKNKLIAIIVVCTIAIIVAIVLFSIKPWERTYTLSVSVNPPQAGSVSPAGGEYESGDQVTLTANSASGYAFGYWSGNASGTTSTITVTMDSNKSLTANFIEFTTSGTGGAVGWVMFPDYTPAYGSAVYIFKSGETLSFATCYVDTNGYYIFNNLPAESYEIYTASVASFWAFTGAPDVTINVWEHETTIVPILTVLKNIQIAFDNSKIATRPDSPGASRYVIDGHNPKFTWANIQNAAYYTVTIWSTYTESHPSNRDYEESQQAVTNMIVWPTSLSSLQYKEFRIDVEAYMEDGTQIASGYELFAIDNPPDGWVYK